jgi:hypothetical protein
MQVPTAVCQSDYFMRRLLHAAQQIMNTEGLLSIHLLTNAVSVLAQQIPFSTFTRTAQSASGPEF